MRSGIDPVAPMGPRQTKWGEMARSRGSTVRVPDDGREVGSGSAPIGRPASEPRSRARWQDAEVLGRVAGTVASPRGSLSIRALNFVVAVAAIVALLPLGLLIAVAIKLDSRGPVFYRQLRVGVDRRHGRGDGGEGARRRTGDLGGRPFLIYKFRTMHPTAEHGTGPVWASPEDGRATRVGRFLRTFRLDEIPQFWNVLKGDMAVVGPRPERPNFVRDLREQLEEYAVRQRVPPGITGWAQVNQPPDRSLDDVRTKLRYDLEYVRRRSTAFDVRIMLRTLPVMLEGDPPRRTRRVSRSESDPRDAG